MQANHSDCASSAQPCSVETQVPQSQCTKAIDVDASSTVKDVDSTAGRDNAGVGCQPPTPTTCAVADGGVGNGAGTGARTGAGAGAGAGAGSIKQDGHPNRGTTFTTLCKDVDARECRPEESKHHLLWEDYPRPPPPTSMTSTLNDKAAVLAASKVDYMATMEEILPGLFYGSVWSARDAALMKENRISRVVTCMVALPEPIPGVTYKLFKMVDSSHPDTVSRLEAGLEGILAWIDEQLRSGHRVLVHCRHGMSRSGAVMLAYMMRYAKMTMQQAWSHLASHRRCLCPNDSFIGLLQKLEKQWIGVTTPTVGKFELVAWQMMGYGSELPLTYIEALQLAQRCRGDLNAAFDAAITMFHGTA